MNNLILFISTLICWSPTWYLIKFQFGVVDPLISIFYRFLIASAIVFIFLIIFKKKLLFNLHQHFWFLFLGVTLFSLNYIFFYLANTYLISGIVTIAFSTILIMNILGERIYFKIKSSKQTLIARKHEIDIAIDLNGTGEGNRSLIFSHRVAPIQIGYMYAGTMATNYMDYLIADETVIPETSRQFYTEKILNLPNCYMVRDSKLIIANLEFEREELGLPNNGFVFCCFNQSSKINPETFDSWCRILNKVEDSVLWLLEDNSLMVDNLKLEAKKRSIDPKRIIFAKKRPQPFYLGLYKYADLFLDTLPYNAHTTAGDALWADLPVLTCYGTTYAGRVAASHLKAIQLPELITYSRDEFEKLAVELANNSEKLKSIKEKLIANKNNTPLFDTKLFVRNFEDYIKQLL